ncbi:MAG: sugar phosphate isomerase/epimerase [Planctomycetota bacterium]|nr:sugar phosphate isomerase/epimerase [Planctomycetota bacterium]
MALTLPKSSYSWASIHSDLLFKISLAQWSLHRALRAGELDNLDFAKVAKEDYGIEAIEYVNQFFRDQAENRDYLKQMKQRTDDHGVENVLIMIDGVGALGAADEKTRMEAVEGHYPWVEAAKFLGCHCIRVNASSEGTYDEQMERAADGLSKLTEFASKLDMSVTVENHGGWSSNGAWLSGVMKLVDHPRCGTLPDFGNFRMRGDEWYDRYKGVAELMPFAKAVSAKSHDFDEDGNETGTDYRRMMKIVLDAGYRGYVGIEYEGSKHSEPEGIRLTKALLETVRQEMTSTPPATSPDR